MHTHTWQRSDRKHEHPPRFYVVCECGEERQAVMEEGKIQILSENRLMVWSFRLTRKQVDDVRRWKKEGWPE
jgi:hypothetical protein